MVCPLGIHHLPLLVVTLFLVTFFTTYALAVFLGHVEADFPYISDTGTYSPESCIFGQMLNICAVLVWCCVYLWYKQVHEYNQHSAHILACNKAALVLGSLSAFGVSMVGNFQESNVLPAHLTGAILAFGVGTLYSWLAAYITMRAPSHLRPRCRSIICVLRLVLCVLTTVTFVCTYVLDSIAKKHFHGKNPKKWFPGDGGFQAHLASTASEWTMAIAFLLFFCTFMADFEQIELTSPQVSRRAQDMAISPLVVDEPNIM